MRSSGEKNLIASSGVQDDAISDNAGSIVNGSPSSRRHLILTLLFTITVINFIDRQTVSVLAPVIRAAFHLSNEAYGRIVAAFQFGMMSGELPMGWIMDRWGSRIGLLGAVLVWSSATGAQAFVGSGAKLAATRFWMGSSECGNYSGGMKAVAQLFPIKERTLAIGIFNSGSVIGSVIAPPLVVYLAQHYGFRTAFLVPASMGAVWAALWWLIYRNPARDESTAAVVQEPLRSLLQQPSTWAVMLCRFFVGPVIQFYWYWLPSFLFTAEKMSMTRIGALSWIPFFLGGVGGVAGGWSAGWLQRRAFGQYDVRRITMYGSSILCLTSLAVPFNHNTVVLLLMMSIAIFGHNFLSANMYGAITDLFGENAVGRVTGLTGVAGGLSGLLFPLLTGFLVDRVSYTPVFLLASVMPLVGTVALLVIARRHRFDAVSGR
jgi:MFS transporter, ACS family, aldohexuronate transporter